MLVNRSLIIVERCFAHDSANFDNKELAKRTVSDKDLKDRACEIAINPKYNGYKRGLPSIVSKFVRRKQSAAKVNEVPAQELHKPAIKK